MKLKKLTLILLLILPIFTVACKKKDVTGTTKNSSREIATNAEEIKDKMNLSPLELIKLGKTFKCTFDFEDETKTIHNYGTVYVDKDKMYMEGTTEFNLPEDSGYEMDPDTMATLLVNDKYYTWNPSSKTQGYVMAVEDVEARNKDMEFDEEENKYAEAMNMQTEYSCSKWVAKKSMFEVPEDITFIDMEEELQKWEDTAADMEESMKDTTKSMCGTCDMMPDETQRAECRVSLGCD